MKNISQMSKADRARYLGNPDQMYAVRRVSVEDGRAKNTTEYQVTTGGGLSYTVLVDNGLDIGSLSSRGINMNYVTKNGETSPYLAETYEDGFVRYFPAGMVYTCGLLSAGSAHRDGKVWHPSHGRYHNQPAGQLCGEVKDDQLVVRGKIRESQLFGHSLEVERTVTSSVGGKELVITDVITNLTPNPEEFMLLYHCNFGYPFLSEHLKLFLPEGTLSQGRTELANEKMATMKEFSAPIDNDAETVYFHDIPAKDGYRAIRAENPDLGVGVIMRYSADTLPVLAEWKCMRSGEYVLGLEPANNHIKGRLGERENGSIKTIGAFETVKTEVRIEFYDL